MDASAEILYEYLRDIMYEPEQAELDTASLPDDFKELGQGLNYLAEHLAEARAFARSLSKGELNGPAISPKNELAAPLKSLQAMLKHLTWQAQQVAKGDYKQHIDYMGEFSAAFNTILKQLDKLDVSLAAEVERSRQRARSLEQSNDLFEIVTRASAQWIVIVDKTTGEWLYSNYPAMNILADDEFIPRLRRWISERISESDVELSASVRELVLSVNGIAQVLSATIRPILWRERQSLSFVMTDVSAKREHIRELENAAYRDTLTRQYNRHFGMKMLEQWLKEDRDFTLSFVNIDNLKYVNETYGQVEGDDYILSVTAVLRGFSPELLISRLSGDEFMLLAEGWDEVRMATHLEALRGRLLKRNSHPDAKYYYSMSYGAVYVGRDNKYTSGELKALVDSKMSHYQRLHKLEGIPREGK
jgi:diguanylate cyclase (GGDEF) domain